MSNEPANSSKTDSTLSTSMHPGRLFLVDALDLVVSYLHGQDVELDALDLGRGEETSEQFEFRRELNARHALACIRRLRPLLMAIEREPSMSTSVINTLSKGDIVGRLNVPRYLAQRFYTISTPRTYPVLINHRTLNTPENALLVQSLRGLANQLGHAPFPRSTAEGSQCLSWGIWARTRVRRTPWSDVTRFDAIPRLYQEAHARLRRRQTGNEIAYALLLDWVSEWLFDLETLGTTSTQAVVDGLLAFPPRDFFWDRVFEIWCLSQIASSLLRCGCTLTSGPVSLSKASSAIYHLHWKDRKLEIWFQRQQPMGSPQWFYADNNRSLVGIPDIVITDNEAPPLLVDAKFRYTDKCTRSEETYKMLGYAQNFRDQLNNRLEGLLIFIGPQTFHRILCSNTNDRLDILVVNQSHTSSAQSLFDQRISAWLNTLTRNNT